MNTTEREPLSNEPDAQNTFAIQVVFLKKNALGNPTATQGAEDHFHVTEGFEIFR